MNILTTDIEIDKTGLNLSSDFQRKLRPFETSFYFVITSIATSLAKCRDIVGLLTVERSNGVSVSKFLIVGSLPCASCQIQHNQQIKIFSMYT